MDSRTEGTLAEVGRENRGDLHVHSTTEIRGATVLPTWFVAVLILSLSLTMAAAGAAAGVLFWRVDRLEGELRLLQDYTEGRIDHLPYRPDPEPEIRIERSK